MLQNLKAMKVSKFQITKLQNGPQFFMQAPLELVGLGSSSSMDSFASWKINGSGMEKEEREETPLQGEDESRRSSPP